MMVQPWQNVLLHWSPVSIDALGLVTLLGAEEVNAALGRLVPSQYFDYFPMLGAYVIAGDRFKDKTPSFNLYNITFGIQTSDLAYWLTRWIKAQDLEKNRSIVLFEVQDQPKSTRIRRYLFATVPFSLMGFLIAVCVLSGDGYGLANAITMSVSILVRNYLLGANRHAIDKMVVQEDKRFRAGQRKKGEPEKLPEAKCMIITSDSKAITVYAPRHLVVPILLNNLDPPQAAIYHVVRWIGWLAFVLHVLSIGRACLAAQIYSVILIVAPTILICWKAGCEDSKWSTKWQKTMWDTDKAAPYSCWIGTKLKATVFEWPLDTVFTKDRKLAVDVSNTDLSEDDISRKLQTTIQEGSAESTPPSTDIWYRLGKGQALPSENRASRMMDLYARLNLTDAQEESLGKWDLFPHKREETETWWQEYTAKKKLIAHDPPDIEDMKTRVFISRKGTTSEQTARRSTLTGSRSEDMEKGSAHVTVVPPFGVARAPTDKNLTASGFV